MGKAGPFRRGKGEEATWKSTRHPRQGLGLVRKLQKGLERRVVHILEVAGSLKGFKQRRDLARFLDHLSSWVEMGGRKRNSE